MKHGSLFSGIGGFDLAAEWLGWENAFHCEINDFGRKVLNYHFPKSISYEDITKTDFTIHRGHIDVLSGGFPCQPFSMAGKRKGKEDERHLWPQMLRAIREIRPKYIVGENVYGLINWDGGLVFDEVQSDLEAEGYEVIPVVLPAVSVNAPHRRDRVWFVAANTDSARLQEERPELQATGVEQYRKLATKNTNCDGRDGELRQEESKERRFGDFGAGDNERICTNNAETTPDTTSNRRERERKRLEAEEGHETRPESAGELEGRSEGLRKKRDAANTENSRRERECVCEQGEVQFNRHSFDNDPYTDLKRLQRGENIADIGEAKSKGEQCGNFARCFRSDFRDFPTQSPVCSGDDGLPTELDGITFSKWRNESIKAYGNAIVPQVAYEIFKVINNLES